MSNDNLIRVMDSFVIDHDIRGLVQKMWKHGYSTLFSCKAQHSYRDYDVAYILFDEKSGDGWFEKNSWRYGINKINNSDCCQDEGATCCPECGAGMNGFAVYRGRLISDPELSGIDKELIFDFLA